MKIIPYIRKEAEYLPHDPLGYEVVQSLSNLINSVNPSLTIEHIGSTAVSGCSGKGVINLAILYPTGLRSEARETLDQLGLQRQSSKNPFLKIAQCELDVLNTKDKYFAFMLMVLKMYVLSIKN
jgi:GrpB-like predicted nucleotidyltransferase (UPF0157 family)